MYVKKIASQTGFSCHNGAKAFAKGLIKMDKFEEWLELEIEQTKTMIKEAKWDSMVSQTAKEVLLMLNVELATLCDILDKYREIKQPAQDDLTGLAEREAEL